MNPLQPYQFEKGYQITFENIKGKTVRLFLNIHELDNYLNMEERLTNHKFNLTQQPIQTHGHNRRK